MIQKASPVFELTISLHHVTPEVSRSLLVDSDIPLPELHLVLQWAMGWTNSHLHDFECGGVQYGIPDPDFESDDLDEREFRLSDLLSSSGDSLIYRYDFGDDWTHTVTLVKIHATGHSGNLPIILEAKRRCPSEDVGGPWGYEEFLEALSDSTHEMHQQYVDWIGTEFDPEVAKDPVSFQDFKELCEID